MCQLLLGLWFFITNYTEASDNKDINFFYRFSSDILKSSDYCYLILDTEKIRNNPKAFNLTLENSRIHC